MRNMVIAIVLLVFVVIPLAVMKYGDNTQEEYKQVAYMANGLSVAVPFKTYVEEYYYTRGRMPADNAEIGMPQPDAFADQAVRSVEVKDGSIVVTYNAMSGVEGGIIRLSPDPGSAGPMMKWRCESPTYPHINKYMPQCSYVDLG